MSNLVSIVIFSKDRVCQLEACLRSLFGSMSAKIAFEVSVLYKASTALHAKQYEDLKTELPRVRFVEESDFEANLRGIITGSEYTLFAVDDSLFIADWSLDECCEALAVNPSAIGFSLRLGKNINFCYPLQRPQGQPEFREQANGVLCFDWTTAECDFGYPMELSSSLYRTHDVENCLSEASFNRPNVLERRMYERLGKFRESHSDLLCYRQSVAFACPVNITQELKSNCHGLQHPVDAEELARDYDHGLRIDLAPLKGFVPVSCHQEIELKRIPKPD